MIFWITLHFRLIPEFFMTFDIVRGSCVTFDLSLTFYLYVTCDVLANFYTSHDL